jgi:hypothetical protein
MSLSEPTLAKGAIGARWRIADFAAVAADAGALRRPPLSRACSP